MDSGKVNWQNFLKKVSKDVQIVERSLAHDDEVSIDYRLQGCVLCFHLGLLDASSLQYFIFAGKSEREERPDEVQRRIFLKNSETTAVHQSKSMK